MRHAVLYGSIALNAALLVLLAWPRSDTTLALEQVSSNVGNYAAVTSKGGGNQDALWLVDRVSGVLLVYQYQLGDRDAPVHMVGRRNLRDDFQQRQLGNMMLLSMDYSTNRGVVLVIDTDSERMAVYDYNRSDETVTGLQKIDLRVHLGKVEAPEE